MAEQVLNDPRIKFRPLREHKVEQIASDIKNGRWQRNAETVKIDWNGVMIDGQHRMWGVIEAGKPAVMLTAYGLDPDTIVSIDTGSPRAFRDVASMKGYANGSLLAAASRWLWWYLQGQSGTPSAGKATHAELERVLLDNPDLVERTQEMAGSKARKILAPGVLVFVYLMAYRDDRVKAAEWVELLESGADMGKKHPVYQLRERLIANRTATLKLQPIDVCALAAKSWVYYKTGRQVAALRFAKTEPFPKLG
jgi:hypothetical protein